MVSNPSTQEAVMELLSTRELMLNDSVSFLPRCGLLMTTANFDPSHLTDTWSRLQPGISTVSVSTPSTLTSLMNGGGGKMSRGGAAWGARVLYIKDAGIVIV